MLDRDHANFTGFREIPKVRPADTIPPAADRSSGIQVLSPSNETTDTLSGSPQESYGSGPDTMQIAPPVIPPDQEEQQITDTVQISIPGSGTQTDPGSVWDRIDSRDRQIEETQPEAPAPVRQTASPAMRVPVAEPEPETVFRHDASYYLDPSVEFPYFSEHIFPVTESGVNGKTGSMTVFLETGTRNFRNSSTEYKEYLETDISGYESDDMHYSATWIPGLVILSLLMLAWIKLAYVQFLTPVLFSTFNYKEALKLYNSKNTPANNAFIILHIIFAVNSGLFLLFLAWHYNFNLPPVSPPLLFLFASLLLVFLFGFKAAALGITGFLFDSRQFFAEYAHNVSLYNKIFGILLMPLIVGLLYADPAIHTTLIHAGLALGVIIYLLQLVRGLEIIVRKEFSVFYLILYLCAFEILPLCILYKLVDTFLI